jgi:hypothetical protein
MDKGTHTCNDEQEQGRKRIYLEGKWYVQIARTDEVEQGDDDRAMKSSALNLEEDKQRHDERSKYCGGAYSSAERLGHFLPEDTIDKEAYQRK